MRKFMRYATVPMSIAALSACADQSSGPTGPQGNLELNIAPLALPGITDADYGILVTNGLNQPVWSEASLKSTQYGDGKGALTYIGTCDADEAVHTVALTINSVTDTDSTFVTATSNNNPCKSTAPCTVTATCSENADVFVEFNLTIMREADQGFFDVAVNFADTFCSAKLDCVVNLFPDSTGARTIDAAVVGFACTSGKDSTGAAQPTYLHVDYNVGEANLNEGIRGNGDYNADALGGAYAIYADAEQIDANLSKGFWNAAIALPASGSISFSGTATATQGPDLPLAGVGKYNSYPVIKFGNGAAVTVPDGCAGTWPQKLDGAGSAVVTKYATSPAGEFTSGRSSALVSTLEE